MLLNANLLTGLYLRITVHNPFTVMILRRRKTSCLPIIGLQEVVVDMRDYKMDSGDFKPKVDIPFFSGNLNIEYFIDWITDIDKFFDYIEVSEKRE